MGQRLVMVLEQDNKEVAAIYYHWSAYTYSALDKTKKIIDCIYNGKHETMDQLLLRVIRYLEANGGGVVGNEDEFSYVQSLYPYETFKRDGVSRNDGIIALSPHGIKESKDWSEGDVYINFDTDQVDFCVYSGYEDIKEYIEERKSWDDDFTEEDLKDMPRYDICLGYFDVTDIDDVLYCIGSTNAHVIQCGNEICELIE